MIVNARGVVLTRQSSGEADKMVSIYTEDYGKVRARCAGVSKPGRKMKAFCEPFVWAEFRLHMSHRFEIAKIIGGQMISSFPRARTNYQSLLTGLSFCETLNYITPERSPNALKYELIVAALQALEKNGPNPWLLPAYGLRLLDLAGLHGEDSMDEEKRQRLLGADLRVMGNLNFGNDGAKEIEDAVAARVEDYSGRRLRCPEALRGWRMGTSPC